MTVNLAQLDADLHNFGRRTELTASGHIRKYRSLLPEFLFFGEQSPFRQLVNQLFGQLQTGATLLPALQFFGADPFAISLAPRDVEFLQLAPMGRPFSKDDYQQIGAYIALCAYVGFIDLHRHNLSLGLQSGRFVFVSLDCETLQTQVSNAVSTGLFCHESDCTCKSKYCLNYGLSILQPDVHRHLDSMPAEIISGQQHMRRILLQNSREIDEAWHQTIGEKPLMIRQLYNFTYRYAQAVKNRNFIGFSHAEREQLVRGEIPYFFRVAGQNEVFFWKDPTHYERYEKSATEALFPPQSRFELNETLATQLAVKTAASLDFWPQRVFKSEASDVTVIYKRDSMAVLLNGQLYTHKRLFG